MDIIYIYICYMENQSSTVAVSFLITFMNTPMCWIHRAPPMGIKSRPLPLISFDGNCLGSRIIGNFLFILQFPDF